MLISKDLSTPLWGSKAKERPLSRKRRLILVFAGSLLLFGISGCLALAFLRKYDQDAIVQEQSEAEIYDTKSMAMTSITDTVHTHDLSGPSIEPSWLYNLWAPSVELVVKKWTKMEMRWWSRNVVPIIDLKAFTVFIFASVFIVLAQGVVFAVNVLAGFFAVPADLIKDAVSTSVYCSFVYATQYFSRARDEKLLVYIIGAVLMWASWVFWGPLHGPPFREFLSASAPALLMSSFAITGQEIVTFQFGCIAFFLNVILCLWPWDWDCQVQRLPRIREEEEEQEEEDEEEGSGLKLSLILWGMELFSGLLLILWLWANNLDIIYVLLLVGSMSIWLLLRANKLCGINGFLVGVISLGLANVVDATNLSSSFPSPGSTPRMLPTTVDILKMSKVSQDELSERKGFWIFILLFKWVMLGFVAHFWHFILIKCPLYLEKVSTFWEQLLSKRRGSEVKCVHNMQFILSLFLIYHMCHNAVLLAITDISISNDWLSDDTGLDWEMWNCWMNWIIIMTNITCIVKYSWNFGMNIEHSGLSVCKAMLPGLGADIHFAKDWFFIGFCFILAREHLDYRFSKLGWVSIVILFAPTLCFLLLPKYRQNPSLAASFVYSHWPVVGASEISKAGKSSFSEVIRNPEEDLQRALQIKLVELWIVATTPWHLDVVWTSELPQLACEVAVCIWSRFQAAIIATIVVTLAKACGLSIANVALPSFVRRLGSIEHLRKYVQLHGLENTYLLREIFDIDSSTLCESAGVQLGILELVKCSMGLRIWTYRIKEGLAAEEFLKLIDENVAAIKKALFEAQVNRDFEKKVWDEVKRIFLEDDEMGQDELPDEDDEMGQAEPEGTEMEGRGKKGAKAVVATIEADATFVKELAVNFSHAEIEKIRGKHEGGAGNTQRSPLELAISIGKKRQSVKELVHKKLVEHLADMEFFNMVAETDAQLFNMPTETDGTSLKGFRKSIFPTGQFFKHYQDHRSDLLVSLRKGVDEYLLRNEVRDAAGLQQLIAEFLGPLARDRERWRLSKSSTQHYWTNIVTKECDSAAKAVTEDYIFKIEDVEEHFNEQGIMKTDELVKRILDCAVPMLKTTLRMIPDANVDPQQALFSSAPTLKSSLVESMVRRAVQTGPYSRDAQEILSLTWRPEDFDSKTCQALRVLLCIAAKEATKKMQGDGPEATKSMQDLGAQEEGRASG